MCVFRQPAFYSHSCRPACRDRYQYPINSQHWMSTGCPPPRKRAGTRVCLRSRRVRLHWSRLCRAFDGVIDPRRGRARRPYRVYRKDRRLVQPKDPSRWTVMSSESVGTLYSPHQRQRGGKYQVAPGFFQENKELRFALRRVGLHPADEIPPFWRERAFLSLPCGLGIDRA